MNSSLHRRFEMALRVRDFLRAHPAAQGMVFARLDELLRRAHALASQQCSGVVASRASTEQRTRVRRALQGKLLEYLAAAGTVEGAQFRQPLPHATNNAFLTIARGMLQRATDQKELLQSRGMPETLLDDLAQLIAEFEKTLEATRAARRDHVGASADLRAVARDIAEHVRVLDGLVRYRFGDNAELMGAWESAKSVVGPVGGAPGAVAAA